MEGTVRPHAQYNLHVNPSSEIDYYLAFSEFSGAADALQYGTTTIAISISFDLGLTSVVVSVSIDCFYCVSVWDHLS